MNPDELRALADALEPMAKAPRFEDFDVPAFCAWVRAQADARPIAKIERVAAGAIALFTPSGGPFDMSKYVGASLYTHPAPSAPAGWKWVPVEPTPEMLSAVGMMDGYDWHAPGCSPDADHANWYSAMIAAAPAVPQAEPKRKDQSLRDLLAVIHRDGGHHTEAVGIEQSIKDAQAAVCALRGRLAEAESKREPLPSLAPTHRCPACGAFWRQCDDNSWNLRSASCCGLCDAGRVELVRWLDEPKREPLSDERIAEIQRAAYERAVQECIETAAELRRYADGCTDGRYDWKADGAADCADAIRALGRQQ